MIVDFTGVEAKSPSEFGGSSIIPPGVYDSCVFDVKEQTAKTGKAMIVVEFVISSGSYKGKKVTNYFVVESEIGKATFLSFLHAIQDDEKLITKFDTAWIPKLIGKQLIVRTLNEKKVSGFVNVKIRGFYKTRDRAQAESDYNGDDSDITEAPAPQSHSWADVQF